MILAALALLALPASPEASRDRSDTHRAASQPAGAVESVVTKSAREWLELVDARKWQESWAATGQSFQSLNTVAMWQSASETARVPLGRALSRTLVSEEAIPAPPNGYKLVRFRTRFANEDGAIETLSLAHEADRWKVVGYYVD